MSRHLTVAQIVAMGDALAKCHKTGLTWDDAKPYLIAHVHSTQLPLPLMADFPEIAEINKQAVTLDKAEVLKLVDICYGLDCDICFNNGFMSFESGVKILTKWAQHTHATATPVGLERIAKRTAPSYEIRSLFNCLNYHAGGGSESVTQTTSIFKFNAIALAFCAAYVPEMGDNGKHVRLSHVDFAFAVNCNEDIGREFCDFNK